MNTTRAITRINEKELEIGAAGTKATWHEQYRHSPTIYIGNVDERITEGDLLAIFEQYGKVKHLNLVRDEKSGKSKRFAFLMYEDQRSTDLAVDNFNQIQIGNAVVRVDHVDRYRIPEGKTFLDVDNVAEDAEKGSLQEGKGPNEDVDKDQKGRIDREENKDRDEMRMKRVMQYLEDQRRQVHSKKVDEQDGRTKKKDADSYNKRLSKDDRKKHRDERRKRKQLRAQIRADRKAHRKERMEH